jgi:hypothetical protein
MDATRARLSFEQDHFADHLRPAAVAAVVVLALIVVSLLVREIRFAPRALTTSTAAASGAPAAVVSVATLVLAADRQIRVGDAKPDTLARLAAQTLVTRTEESGPFGVREIRAYAGFTLVFEPFARAGDARVAAIYVQ